MKKKILIIIIVLATIITCLFLLTKFQKTDKNSELVNSKKADYSDEIQLILDYANTINLKINKKSAEQLVDFSHKNGIGTLASFETAGYEFYYENGEEITTSILILYSEADPDQFVGDAFIAAIGKENGDIYKITYNDQVYYTKDNTLNENDTNLKNIDWSGLEITIDGIKYSYPWSISEFIDNGWKPADSYSSYYEEQLNKNLSADDQSIFELDHSDYSADMTISVQNTSSEDIKAHEATIIDFWLGQYGDREKPLFEFYGIKAGDSKEDVENIFGIPEDTYTDEIRGYIDYEYKTTLQDGTDVELVLTFNIDEDELYEIDIFKNLD